MSWLKFHALGSSPPADGTDEVVVFDDVALMALWAATEDDRAGEAARVVQLGRLSTAKATASFVKKHAATIASIAAGVVVFAGCMVLTGGAGSIGCAALAGVAASLVTQGARCYDGQQGACSAGSFTQAAVIGGITGAAGAGLGELAGGLAGAAGDALGGILTRAAGETPEERLALTAVPERQALTAGPERLALPSGERVPYQAAPIRSFVTAEDRTYYRVFSGDRSVGSFLTGAPPASADQAVAGLALPPANTADLIQEVLVPAGTRLQSSIAESVFGQPGGMLQFELLDRIPIKNFGEGVPFR